MEQDKIIAVLNENVINKLDSMSMDIKYYINTNAAIANSIKEVDSEYFKLIDDEDMTELLNIRKQLKSLSCKLKHKLKL